MAGLLFLLLRVPPLSAGDEPADFRGMRWGISAAAAEIHIQEQWKKRRADGEIIVSTDIQTRHVDERLKRLFYSDRIGDVRTSISLTFLDDSFVQVSLRFPSKSFSTMAGAFTTRYGRPTAQRERTLQNRAGLKIPSTELTWTWKAIDIVLRQHGSRLDESEAQFGTLEYQDYVRSVGLKQKQKAAGDL